MTRLGLIAIVFWAIFVVWIVQADAQCHLGHVPWPLESC